MRRIPTQILISIILLTLAFSTIGATPTQAATNNPPAGLSPADWAQIKPMIPALALPSSQQAYLKASNTGLNDWFGLAVAVDGNTAVVGAIGEGSNATGVNGNQTDNSMPRAGAVYVFVRSGNTWSQQAYLKSAAPDGDDYFGYSVGISGDTIVVGVPNEDSSATGINGNAADDSAANAGAAYIFTRIGTNWTQQAYLKASNTDAGDGFAEHVAIDGNTVLVSASYEDSNGSSEADDSLLNAGAAYVFTRSLVTWSQQAYLKSPNPDSIDYFGVGGDISGDTIVVSAKNEDSSATGVNGNSADDTVTDSGAAFVFTRSGTVWSQQAYLKASNTEGSDWFGQSVGIDGDTIVVGAPGEDSNGSSQSDNSVTTAGAAYVFTRSGVTWSQQQYLKAANTAFGDSQGDGFGVAVAISGDRVLVSSPGEDSNATGINGDQTNNTFINSGAAYLFTRSGVTWTQQQYLKASNTGPGDDFSQTQIALDGDTVIVGAWLEDSDATGVDGDGSNNSTGNSGAAYIFAPSCAITVTSNADSGPGTLRQALLDVCAGGTITFDPGLSGATINLASTLTLTDDVTIDGSALATPITISGDTDSNGSGDVRVFTINTGVTATLDSLTITKGNHATLGGGIYNNGGTLTINNSTISANSTQNGNGGGIYSSSGTLKITDSTITGNSANGVANGGGIYLTNSVGTVQIINSTISNNSANFDAAGIYNTAGTVAISNSTISGNSASFSSGGILNTGSSVMTVTNSTISGNSAGTGAGGGINNLASTMTIINSTISNNVANSSSGAGLRNTGTLNYTNTIIANSTGLGDCSSSGGTISTNINNLVENGSCSATLSGDPNLGPLANNGGSTFTHALLTGSTAIDAGNDAACAGVAVNNLDQRGITRPQGAHCDIGAYEAAATATATPTATSTATATSTPTLTPTVTPTTTSTATATPTITLTATATETPTITSTATITPTPTATHVLSTAYDWHTFFGGAGSEGAQSVAVDGAGNIILAAYGDFSWNGPSGQTPLNPHSSSVDILVVKLDSSGNYLWHTFVGGSGVDYPDEVAVDASGNIFVTGYSSATWNGPGATAPLTAYTGNSDIVVVKLNSAGAYQWHSFFGGSNLDIGQSLAVDSAGNVVVGGYSSTTWTGPGAVAPLHAFASSREMTIIKLNTNGAYQWHTFYGASSSSDEVFGVAIDSADNILLAGYSALSWNGPGSVAPLNPASTGYNFSVLKLNSAGTYQWHTFYGADGAANDDWAYGLTLDGSDNPIVVGYASASWNGPGSVPPLNAYTGSGNQDLAILKLNSAGAYQWHTFYGSTDIDAAYAAAVDGDQNIIVAGFSNAVWNGPGSIGPNNPFTPGGSLGEEGTILSLSPAGAYQWHSFYGSNNRDFLRDVTIDANGNYIFAGDSPKTWNTYAGQTPLHAYSGAGWDILAMKFAAQVPPTATPTATATATPTVTATATSTATATVTPTVTATATPTATETATPTVTATATATATETATSTATATPTVTATATSTATATPTVTETATPTVTATATSTATATATPTVTATATPTTTETATPTVTATATPTATETATSTATETATATATATATPTATETATPTVTATATSTATETATSTATATATPTATETATATATETATPTATETATATATETATPTSTATATPTVTATATQTDTPTITPVTTVTPTVTASHTLTPTLTRTLTPTPTKTGSMTRTATRTMTRTQTPTRTKTVTVTKTRTRTPTITPTSVDNSNLIWNQSYAIRYDSWLGVSNTNAFSGGYRHAQTGTFTFRPSGTFTTFSWITYRGPDQGKAQVIVDGVIKATVDLYQAAAQWQHPVTITGLTNTSHVIVIKALNIKNAASSNTWVAVDGFTTGSAVLPAARTVYDDQSIYMNNTFSYGSWDGMVQTNGPRFGAYRISSAANATLSFSFTGSKLTWTTARGPAYGKAVVYIDGVLVKTVDLYKSSLEWQYKVVFTGLTNRNHSVVIKTLSTKNSASSGTGIVCDGFEIQ